MVTYVGVGEFKLGEKLRQENKERREEYDQHTQVQLRQIKIDKNINIDGGA
jgi:hypothetical protein